MQLMVETVRRDALDVPTFGGPPQVVPGRTEVEFRIAGGPCFNLDWTYLGDVPEPGAIWNLTPEVE